MRKSIAACGFVLMAFAWLNPIAASQSGNNLIHNGGFEQGVEIGSYKPLNSGSTDITGWVVTRGQIDYVSNQSGHGASSSQGTRYVDLDGTPGNGGVRQTVSTIPGARYRLQFDLGGDRNGAPVVKVMGLQINQQNWTFQFDSSQSGTRKHQLDFVASTPKTGIEFFSMHNNNGYYGPTLDNVSLTLLSQAESVGTGN